MFILPSKDFHFLAGDAGTHGETGNPLGVFFDIVDGKTGVVVPIAAGTVVHLTTELYNGVSVSKSSAGDEITIDSAAGSVLWRTLVPDSIIYPPGSKVEYCFKFVLAGVPRTKLTGYFHYHRSVENV